jgi:hypothetical protein
MPRAARANRLVSSYELTCLGRPIHLAKPPTILSQTMNHAAIMRELARNDIFPKEAMSVARADRDMMVPIFVDLVSRLGTSEISEVQESEVTALIPIFHLLGEWREPRAYKPLLQMLRQPTKTVDYLLGDAITETSFRVIAGTFDGDLQPLFEAIEDPDADEFASSSLMSALVVIAQLHPEHRSTIEDYFRTFRQRGPKASPDLLIGWMDAVADLGLEDMAEDVRAVFEQQLIPRDYCSFEHFLESLQATQDADGAPANRRYKDLLITDAIEDLSQWYCYTDAFFAQQKASRSFPMPPPSQAFMHDMAQVGRNDPCPCGSGKKFKKCCLQ